MLKVVAFMRRSYLSCLVPAAALTVACTAAPDAPPRDARDLSLPMATPEAAPVLSSLERGVRSHPHAPAPQRVRRAPAGIETTVAATHGEVEAVVAGQVPVPEPVLVATGSTAHAAPTPAPATGGLGAPLGTGETITIVPAIADDGSSGGGGRGQGMGGFEGMGRHGGGMMGGYDDCAPSRGGVIAVNQPIVGRPSRYRRH